ncbi:MAG: hypothetical protein J6V23_00095 [Bacteroidaceae bacterium]|jgi:hypothetical protein|nr:hypothetical protein [Bacteroidaceae bacterium]
MSSIVSILVLGAIYSIIFVVKSLRSNPEKGNGSVFNEGFPVIEVLEPETEYTAPVTSTKEFKEKAECVTTCAPQTVEPGVAERETDEKAGDGRLVKLNSKSDAKRAFLYSEIFNRKY